MNTESAFPYPCEDSSTPISSFASESSTGLSQESLDLLAKTMGTGVGPDAARPSVEAIECEGLEVLECPEAFATAFANNMAVGNHQIENENTAEVKGGIDTLELSFVIAWRHGTDERRNVLQKCQENAKAQDESGSYFRLGNSVFKVWPNGGGGGSGVYRHFIFEGISIHFEISKCSASHDQYFNAFVRVGSVKCNSLPPEVIYKQICVVFGALGGTVLGETVTRCDLYVDNPTIGIDQVVQAWSEKRIITRARKFGLFGSLVKPETFQVGVATRLRCYDKLAELLAKPDKRKEEQIRGRFGGNLPETLTRFEFQLRRKFLRESKIDTFSQLMESRNSIGGYLTREWLRIAEGDVDRHHSDRASTAPWWEKVASAFESIGDIPRQAFVRVKTRVRHAPSLIRQAFGCLLKALHPHCTSPAGFLAEIHEQIRKEIVDMGADEFNARLSRCHAEGELATSDVALSGPPKKITAEAILERLQRLLRGKRETKRQGQESLPGFVNDQPFTSWNDDDDEQPSRPSASFGVF